MGTRVRDSTYEKSIAKTTASAIGTKRKRATPVRKNIGTNTMQMHSVATNAGTPISPAPTMIASCRSRPSCRWRSMFSMVTIAWSTRMPTESARPPSVMRLSVSPSALSARIEARIDRGMVSAMMTVERQLPRKSSTISAVSPAAITASITTPFTAAFTKTDWSKRVETFMSVESTCVARGSRVLRLSTMSSVEAPPFLSTDSSTPRTPSCRTMLVWFEKPSRTAATSRT